MPQNDKPNWTMTERMWSAVVTGSYAALTQSEEFTAMGFGRMLEEYRAKGYRIIVKHVGTNTVEVTFRLD